MLTNNNIDTISKRCNDISSLPPSYQPNEQGKKCKVILLRQTSKQEPSSPKSKNTSPKLLLQSKTYDPLSNSPSDNEATPFRSPNKIPNIQDRQTSSKTNKTRNFLPPLVFAVTHKIPGSNKIIKIKRKIFPQICLRKTQANQLQESENSKINSLDCNIWQKKSIDKAFMTLPLSSRNNNNTINNSINNEYYEKTSRNEETCTQHKSIFNSGSNSYMNTVESIPKKKSILKKSMNYTDRESNCNCLNTSKEINRKNVRFGSTHTPIAQRFEIKTYSTQIKQYDQEALDKLTRKASCNCNCGNAKCEIF